MPCPLALLLQWSHSSRPHLYPPQDYDVRSFPLSNSFVSDASHKHTFLGFPRQLPPHSIGQNLTNASLWTSKLQWISLTVSASQMTRLSYCIIYMIGAFTRYDNRVGKELNFRDAIVFPFCLTVFVSIILRWRVGCTVVSSRWEDLLHWIKDIINTALQYGWPADKYQCCDCCSRQHAGLWSWTQDWFNFPFGSRTFSTLTSGGTISLST